MKQGNEEKQQKKSRLDQNNLFQQSQQPKFSQYPSLECQTYLQKMENIECENVDELENKLQKHKVIKTQRFHKSLEKIILEKSGNAYLFKISTGYFQMNISLLRLHFSSQIFGRRCFASGSFAEIYTSEFDKRIYAIKSQKIKEDSLTDFGADVDLILNEYFSFKIASLLEFGPRLERVFGFDIIYFNDSMEFCMQFCPTIYSGGSENAEKFSQDLMKNLKTMHSLKMVHRDIKNQNVAWSSFFKKWVFLDFGFTSFLQQKQGLKTFTTFKGTYNYTSRELKNLYHLKKSAFVDLYSNDVYGMEIVLGDTFQHSNEFKSLQRSPFFSDFIVLCLMEYFTFSYEFEMIQEMFRKYQNWSLQFLGLLLRRIQIDKIIEEKKTCKLHLIYQKIEKNHLMETENVEKKKRAKYLKLFIGVEQNSKEKFLFLNEKDLKKLLHSKWGQLSFMKDLFIFYDEVIYSNYQDFWKRIKIITDIVIDFLLIQKDREKSWLWKFHRILLEFEQIFFESKQYLLLNQILCYYQLINDHSNWQNLMKKMCILNNDLKIQNKFIDLFQNILQLHPANNIKQCLDGLKKELNEKEQKKIYGTLFQIAEFIGCFCLPVERITPQKVNQFDILINNLQNNSSYDDNFVYSSMEYLNKLKNKFIYTNSEHSDNLAILIKPIQIQNRKKHNVLKKIVNKLDNLVEDPSSLMQPFFQAFPICMSLPRLFNLQYFFKIGNYDKFNQIRHNIYFLNYDNLQNVTHQINYMTIRWGKQENIKQQSQFFYHIFLCHYQRKISEERIRKYWVFFFTTISNLQFNKISLDKKIRQQIISALKFITDYFSFSKLSLQNQIYIHLLNFLSSFLKGAPMRVDNWLQKMEYTGYLKENKEVLCEVIQYFSFYESITKEYCFSKTQFYEWILQSKIINWIFLKSPFFLNYFLIIKASEQKQIETFFILKKFTSYLTFLNDRVQTFCYSLGQFFSKTKISEKILLDLMKLQSISEIRQNNYFSGIVFMTLNELIKQNKIVAFKNSSQIKRIYTLSVISIDKFPDYSRIIWRKKLSYMFRDFYFFSSHRKNKILNRREDYAREKILYLKKDVMKQYQKKRMKGLRIYGEIKLRLLEKNLNSEIASDITHKFTRLTSL